MALGFVILNGISFVDHGGVGMNRCLLGACVVWSAASSWSAAVDVEIIGRHVAAEQYCAWPNVTKLPDGTLAAIIYNQPSHAKLPGEVECWTSSDGGTWKKTGNPTPHDPDTNRMNVGAGLNRRGELVVLSSGWALGAPVAPGDAKRKLLQVLPCWSSTSSDGGKTWRLNKNALPEPFENCGPFIPFGDVLPADDRSLRAVFYFVRQDEMKRNDVWMFSSNDDGATWQPHALLAEGHNETAIFSLGKGRWLAAARRQREGLATDLYKSDDDGKTWTLAMPISDEMQHPADIMRLSDGRLLLVYGNRQPGKFGVLAKLSRDDGATWSQPLALVDDCGSRDCGYPASVQLADGTVVTGYYADKTPQYTGYQFSTVIWRVPAPKAVRE